MCGPMPCIEHKIVQYFKYTIVLPFYCANSYNVQYNYGT